MLFRQDILEGIAAGRVTLAFRRWRKACEELEQIRTRLAGLDRTSTPWTGAYLTVIGEHPAVLARRLAPEVGEPDLMTRRTTTRNRQGSLDPRGRVDYAPD